MKKLVWCEKMMNDEVYWSNPNIIVMVCGLVAFCTDQKAHNKCTGIFRMVGGIKLDIYEANSFYKTGNVMNTSWWCLPERKYINFMSSTFITILLRSSLLD